MPNWCSNILRVSGPLEDVRKFKEQAVGHSPWKNTNSEPNPLNFHSFVPVPPPILSAGYNEAGYNWERENWGCKWGACETRLEEEGGNYLQYGFETVWVPPIGFLEKLAPQWPTLNFVLDYEEFSMNFKGRVKAAGASIEDMRRPVIQQAEPSVTMPIIQRAIP